MGIQVTQADSMPAVTYDKIHLTKLEIIQPIFEDDTKTPLYQVIISYRHYGVVNGVRYYKNEELQRVSIDDFITLAATDAAQGDMTLVNALGSIEVAVAGIISDQTGNTTTVV
jgi:hypothetical protein